MTRGHRHGGNLNLTVGALVAIVLVILICVI